MRRLWNLDCQIASRPGQAILHGHLRRIAIKCNNTVLLVIAPPITFTRHLPTLQLRRAGIVAFGLFLLVIHAAQAAIISTVEAPGVQSSSAVDTTLIDFNSVSTGYKSSETFSLPSSLTATYQGTQFVVAADQYGGAGGVGNYLAIQANNSVTLTLSASQAYFGMWLSAADSANQIEFYSGNQLVGAFSAAGPEVSSLPAAYLGNPNSQFLGDNGSEPYVFVNFYAQVASDMFNTIVFTNLAGATTFESDNHTFSTTLQAPSPIPEPASVTLLALGLVGIAVMRR